VVQELTNFHRLNISVAPGVCLLFLALRILVGIELKFMRNVNENKKYQKVKNYILYTKNVNNSFRTCKEISSVIEKFQWSDETIHWISRIRTLTSTFFHFILLPFPMKKIELKMKCEKFNIQFNSSV
jgi:hypothetical protein